MLSLEEIKFLFDQVEEERFWSYEEALLYYKALKQDDFNDVAKVLKMYNSPENDLPEEVMSKTGRIYRKRKTFRECIYAAVHGTELTIDR